MKIKRYLIWDLPLRLFHWLFALTILGCWGTHELGSDYIDWHMRLGYVALALLLFRLIWGVVGTKHSQFRHFVCRPQAIVEYLRTNLPQQPPGHNPLGSLMVIAMLGLVLLQVVSGLFVDDEIFTTGPYFNALGGEFDAVMNSIHHNAFNFISIAILLHVVAIIYYQRVKQKNLTKPMITGYKSQLEVDPDEAINNSRILLALIVAIACAGFVYWLVVVNAPPVDDFY